MEITSLLSSVIYSYAKETKKAFIDFNKFCNFIKKYAEANIETYPELEKFLENPESILLYKLQALAEKHIATIISLNKKKTIVSLAFIANYYSHQYKEILKDESVPYPIPELLPKNIPLVILEQKNANEYILELISQEEETKEQQNCKYNNVLYIIDFEGTAPSMLLPSNISIQLLLITAQKKIRKLLKKTKSHDYFLKKLKNTNHVKENAVDDFYAGFIDNDEFIYTDFSEYDSYYLWNQVLFYIYQDYNNLREKTVEDINILQSCRILEFQSAFLKEKGQLTKEKKEAFQHLEANLTSAPFYYSADQILQFKDSNNQLLYGRYTEEELKNYLQEKTTEDSPYKLPSLLTFSLTSGTKYYIYKNFVIKVIIGLCDKARSSIEKKIENYWYRVLLEFHKLPEMTNNNIFEECLKQTVEETYPILYELLTANFIPLLISEISENEESALLKDGHLPPCSELLMIYREKILANAKSRLPFYYNIKIIYWIMKFFSLLGGYGKNVKYKNEFTDNKNKQIETTGKIRKVSGSSEISEKAKKLAEEIVPQDSTIDQELKSLINKWNKMITKETYDNLVIDINTLVKNYIKRVKNKLSINNFSIDLINDFATTLVDSSTMKDISDHKDLKQYIVLYIIKLLSKN